MPSQLDRELAAIMDLLTAPGAPLETVQVARFGTYVPAFKNAPASLPAYFERYAAQYGPLDFIIDGEVRLTFAETYALAHEVAAGLIARHYVAPGQPIGIAARNSASWAIVYMAVLMAGGCAVLLNGWWTANEMADGIALSECRLIFADAPRAARLAEIPHGAKILIVNHGDPRTDLADLLGCSGPALPDVGGDDPATILFTSGSTGQSKGAFSDHRGVVHGALSFAAQALMLLTHQTQRSENSPHQPATLVPVPLFHVTGEIVLLLTSMALGRKIILMPRWDPREAMRLIEAEKITYFIGVPLMSHEIATHPERPQFDLSSCQFLAAGGAPRPVEHVATIRSAAPHAYPLLGYGLTETNAVGCGNVNQNYLDKPHSTGPASRPIVEVAILDDAGKHLPSGATGEVAIRSVANFIGYWRNEAATAEAVTADGFFRTGDLGYLDEDGDLFIVDRKKDIIIRGGENIAASEVEAAIYAHPDVAEASVFGLPDARLGEVPVAVFLAREGSGLGEVGLRAHLESHIAGFKIPAKFFEEHEHLPRLGTEKVDKRALKARDLQGWGG
jgi:acyl-CoA synthetase (AMP-forming)/AMP-acid ligase II